MFEAVIIAILMVFLVGVSSVFGQPNHARIGILTPGLTLVSVHEGLREGLSRLGYKEGKNITCIIHDTKGDTSDLAPRAAKLLAAKPDLLITVGALHTAAAKQATATVPIVFAWVSDPLHDGLIASYASSKNNLTGVSTSMAALAGKKVEILLEVSPKVKRLLAVVPSNENIALITLRSLEEAGKKLGVQVVRQYVTNRSEIEKALMASPKGSVDAIFYISSVLMRANVDLLIRKAKSEKIPLEVSDESHVDLGALFSYGPNTRLVGLQAATLVDKVLKGTKPSDTVVEIPEKLFLSINLNTAKEIGLKIPHGILERADRLIE